MQLFPEIFPKTQSIPHTHLSLSLFLSLSQTHSHNTQARFGTLHVCSPEDLYIHLLWNLMSYFNYLSTFFLHSTSFYKQLKLKLPVWNPMAFVTTSIISPNCATKLSMYIHFLCVHMSVGTELVSSIKKRNLFFKYWLIFYKFINDVIIFCTSANTHYSQPIIYQNFQVVKAS